MEIGKQPGETEVSQQRTLENGGERQELLLGF